MPGIYSSRSVETKRNEYRGKDFIKKFFEFLRKHTMKKITRETAPEIIWKCKNLLYLLKNLENKYLNNKKISQS